MSGNEAIRIAVVEGPQKGGNFTVQAGATIGRSRGCAVELDGRHISRVHARLEARPGGLAIIDADSRNGIFVNGEKVRERLLRKDDEIEIGEHVLIFDPSFALDGAALPPNESSPELPRPRAGAAATVLEAILNPLADAPRECLLEAVAALRRLTYVDDERDLGQSLLDELIKATPARRGFLMVADERGRPKPLAKRIPPGEAECRVSNVHYHQVQRRKAIIGTVTSRAGEGAEQSAVAVLAVPMFVGDEYVGFAYLDGPAEGTPPQPCFTRAHLQFVAGLAALAAPVVAAARRTARVRETLRSSLRLIDGEQTLVGTSDAMLQLGDLIERGALHDTPVLVLGEPGTGRGTVARSLHLRGSRGSRSFAAVDCAATAPAALEAYLFGGDGVQSVFDTVRGGTVHLRSIDALETGAQARLVALIDDRASRAGVPGLPMPPDARLIASSSADLEVAAKEGRFSIPLLRKFATILRLPALRDRAADVPQIVAHYLKTLGGRQVGGVREHMTSDALAALSVHAWPGNVRELRNAIERMLIAAQGRTLGIEHIPADITAGDLIARARRLVRGDLPLTTMIAEVEKATLEEALHRAAGNRAVAAELLGVKRPLLVEKLGVFGIAAADRPVPAPRS